MYRSIRRIVVLGAMLATTVHPTFAANDSNQSFQRVWEHNDLPVIAGRADRSWTWGPRPNTAPVREQYDDYARLPEGSRLVQYFDKGRMEINDPAADPNDPWYVTSGHLPRELMTGTMQTGPAEFAATRDSFIAALGDPQSFPAYPELLSLYEQPGTITPGELGRPATDLLNPNLHITQFTDFTSDPATILVKGDNNHGVPQAFIDFQNQQGTVYEDGRFVRRKIFDPLFVFGLPITPAVWVKTYIGGVEQPVLFQVFERRVLTYNPANKPAFQVEMGNVGQHYYQWRYHPEQVSEWVQWDWNSREVRPFKNPGSRYTLDVEKTVTAGPPAEQHLTYRVYYTPHEGAPRELRYSGHVGGVCEVNAALLRPASPHASEDRIGLAVQCVHSPSALRGAGVTFLSSYDGGRTFIKRYQW